MSVFFALATIVMLTTIFMNSAGEYTLSRLFITLVPNFVIFITSIVITPAGGELMQGLSLLQLTLAILPFLFLDFNELGLWALTIPILIAMNIFYEPFLSLIEVEADFSFIQSALMAKFYRATSLLVLGLLLYLTMRSTNKIEQKTKALLSEMDRKNKEQEADKKKLDDYIKEIQKAQEEDKKRNWAADGLAQFVDILRSQQTDIKALCDIIISRLVKYIKANQGSIFVYYDDNDDKHLKLISTYAYDRKKYIEKRINLGQGLVGQCFLEKDIIYMTSVPDNYVSITSGTGESNPNCILIVPLLLNEDVYGVIELASFKKFEKHEIDFVKKLGESIAGTLSNVRINERQKKLLEEAQMSQEMLRSQEEEMRQNMEELQATQEELNRKNAEMEEIARKEKERFNNQIEAQKKIMMQMVEKTKEREKELLAEIAALKKQLEEKS
jgi:putative methionine-R-sulfoxide reductase with GAF domain